MIDGGPATDGMAPAGSGTAGWRGGQVTVVPPTSGAKTAITVIMPTTDWTGPFIACAERVVESIDRGSGDEFIVVFDGEPSPPPRWLADAATRILATGTRSGPGAARNRAADASRGDVLFFVDADVEIAPDAIERVRAAFDADPDLCGLFGTYDDSPAAPGLVSRFRNLLHHHTHVTHPGPAATFWAGCGAMRTSRFLAVDGFDTRYERPSIEDIELGVRVAEMGGSLILDPALRCRHHKCWTLRSMIVTDVFQRAAPWTRLILGRHQLPAALNLDWAGRSCGIAAVGLAVALLAAMVWPMTLVAAVACIAWIVALNGDFYGLCRRKGGLRFATGCVLLHALFFLYSTVTFGCVAVAHRLVGPDD